jgi:cytochrome c oxidase subunit III
MASEIRIVEEAKKPLAMHPKKFALWLFIASIIMLFGAWTSAYIVKRGDAGWSEIVLPWHFWMNSVIIVLSSVSMILSVNAARRDNLEMVKVMVSLTTILGLGFLAGQILAYKELVQLNEYFTGGNVSHSFIYVLTGAHGLHLVGGVVYLVLVLVATFRYKVHSRNMTRIEMCATYWHFLGILWLYLFAFLLLNR